MSWCQKGAESVLYIRCTKHYNVPQLNMNEASGGECGACIAEERDQLRELLRYVFYARLPIGDKVEEHIPEEYREKILRALEGGA